MAQTTYTVLIDDAYVIPEGNLTKDQYVTYVMNYAAESYMKQFKTATVDDGIQAATDAYNASLPSVQAA